MKRVKAEEEISVDQLGMVEEEKRNARISVITNLAIFGVIVLALRIGEVCNIDLVHCG